MKYIPSFITLLNLIAGFVAILLNDPFWSPILILAGAFFDLLDGLAAKALDAISEIGKQLDSLADLITFGIAPAYLYYQFILPHNLLGIISASLLPTFGALRLARFNAKESKSNYFNGLPIPANGIFFLSIPYLQNQFNIQWFNSIFNNQIIILILPLIFGLLMVSNIKMFSFKRFKEGAKNNIIQILFIVCIIVLFLVIKWFTVPLAIILYVIISLLGIKQI